jgi:hypothetical protein
VESLWLTAEVGVGWKWLCKLGEALPMHSSIRLWIHCGGQQRCVWGGSDECKIGEALSLHSSIRLWIHCGGQQRWV